MDTRTPAGAGDAQALQQRFSPLFVTHAAKELIIERLQGGVQRPFPPGASG
jgi:hypothetical protein